MSLLDRIDIVIAVGIVAVGFYLSLNGWDWWWALLFIVYFLLRLAGTRPSQKSSDKKAGESSDLSNL